MKDIVLELLETVRWIPFEERQGKWYEEYLNKEAKDYKYILLSLQSEILK